MYRQAINLVHPSPKDTKSFKSQTYMGMPSINIKSFLIYFSLFKQQFNNINTFLSFNSK